jgi:hypothetical protein
MVESSLGSSGVQGGALPRAENRSIERLNSVEENQMANQHQTQKFGIMLRESLELAQTRLTTFEEEAQKVVQASRKEVAGFLRKVNAQDLFDNDYLKEISGRARHVGADVTARLEGLRERAIAIAGVASRDQVEDIQKDLDRLSRKMDKLLNGGAKKVSKDHKAV